MKNKKYKYYILIIVSAISLLAIMFFTRNYKWKSNILLSNILLFLQMFSYSTAVIGIGTLLINYNKINDALTYKRISRAYDEISYFSKNIYPLINKINKDISVDYNKFIKSHHMNPGEFHRGIMSEAQLNAINKDISDIVKIGSWVNALDAELNKRFLDNDIMKSNIGVQIIPFLYHTRIDLDDRDFFYWYPGCFNLLNKKWVSLTKVESLENYYGI